MSIYQHFRQEEKEFIDQVLDWKNDVEFQYAPKLTGFLDPREQFIVQSVAGSACNVRFFSGMKKGGERARAILYPDYYEPSEVDFEICLFEIQYPAKFVTLSHPEVLGSLTGLGLKRNKFGDILIKDHRIQFFAAKEISDFIKTHLQFVGRTKVSVEEKNLDECIQTEENLDQIVTTVSSLRLDVVLSGAGRSSRQKVQTLIRQGFVKVNWKVVETPSYMLEEGDLLSARGIGRIRLLSVGERTKKGKWRITLGKYK